MSIQRYLLVFISLIALNFSSVSVAESPLSLENLLEQVAEGRISDAQVNKQRELRFATEKNNQARLLKEIQQQQEKLEKQSVQLEKKFDENEQLIEKKAELLNNRLGSLKELFGVLQQVAGDTRGQFENSLTQPQFPARSEFLTSLINKMANSSQLASIEDIEQLWFELQREMTESGKVVKFSEQIITADGNNRQQEVTRVGLFNLISQGKYLDYVAETGRIVELPRQPRQRYLEAIEELEAGNEGLHAFGIDPSRGQILSLLVQSPSLSERIQQGGIVGYIIIGLGFIALLIVLERLIALNWIALKVRRQMTDITQAKLTNPLGRVLNIYHANPDSDVETLELKLGEALLRESPGLRKRILLLKIIAVVAPLLGLLGTVTGMIITFQAITLFGTGDPKLMAGGISQALVTTVLGLCVAIPTLLLHSIVASRSKYIQQILEQQASGMIASHAELRNA